MSTRNGYSIKSWPYKYMFWDKQADFLPLSQYYTICNWQARKVSVCSSRISCFCDHNMYLWHSLCIWSSGGNQGCLGRKICSWLIVWHKIFRLSTLNSFDFEAFSDLKENLRTKEIKHSQFSSAFVLPHILYRHDCHPVLKLSLFLLTINWYRSKKMFLFLYYVQLYHYPNIHH